MSDRNWMQIRSLVIGGGALFLLLAFFSSCVPRQRFAEPQQRAEEVEEVEDIVPEGWGPTGTKGIYMRWCKVDECSKEGVIGDNDYVILKIWCKDRSCGDIYGRINLMDENDVVIGWTNDTAYGDRGQEVLLTFDTHLNFKSARLTELSFR